ncbi:macronuclear development protein 1 [Stylonychia lemnae]|uniref:Macronuclear development protein 1 n=1 Tax=Stylonychia lemnae TaxID=5949 RepID=A0A078AWB2_STYLE|nr:macronuclear development protein 1 [Stylonychia lemnae]|eukprot:CDW86755.1 macronuclear development protein 1 [Stylonychia lemnae]
MFRDKQTLIANFYEFLLEGKSPTNKTHKYCLYQYKLTTVPKIDRDKFLKIRHLLIQPNKLNDGENSDETKTSVSQDDKMENDADVNKDDNMVNKESSANNNSKVQSQLDEQKSSQKQQSADEFILEKYLGKYFKFLKFNQKYISEINQKSYFHPCLLYSVKFIQQLISYSKTIKDKQFTVTITFDKEIDLKNSEYGQTIMQQYFRDYLFNQVIKKCYPNYKRLGYTQIFNPERVTNLKEYDIEIWSGFRMEVKPIEQIPMLNIDIDYLVVRLETVLDVINEIKKIYVTYGESQACQERLQKDIRKAFVGKAVVTRYNNNVYKIKDVDFNQNPECYFVQTIVDIANNKKKLIKKSYTQYLEEKYYKTITDKEQPLLVTSDNICLVPEFCMVTGLSEETWNSPSQLNQVRDVVNATKPDVMRRIVDIKKDFFDVLYKNQSQFNFDEIKISNFPHIMEGVKLEMPTVQMAKLPQGPRVEISTKNVEEFERKIFQQLPIKMFEAPPLEQWALFYHEEDESLGNKLVHTLNESLTTFNYHAKPIQIIKVKGNKFQDWHQSIRDNLSVTVIAAVILIPGTKGLPNQLYSDIKRILIKEIPVPSQAILSQTIEKSKSALFSVCNKLIMQICAKIGGEPWAISELPYFYDCTMVSGYYITSNLISYVCSLNSKATRYWSKCLSVTNEQGDSQIVQQQTCLKLSSLFFESLLAFKLRMNCCPSQIFLFTNQRYQAKEEIQQELDAIQQILSKMQLGAKITLIQVDPSVQTHVKMAVVEQPNRLIPISHGLVIIEKNNTQNQQSSPAFPCKLPLDFYLSSYYNKDINQTTVTQYRVIKDEICCQSGVENGYEQLFQLIHRLCFLYFNHIGPVDMPACLKYAFKQAQILQEFGFKKNQILSAHEHYDKNILGLYYL